MTQVVPIHFLFNRANAIKNHNKTPKNILIEMKENKIMMKI